MPRDDLDHLALAFLRREKLGVVAADDRLWRVRAVVCPRTGAIIADLSDTLAGRDDIVLHLPDEGDDAMHLLVGAAPPGPAHAGAVARWGVYHNEDDRATLLALTPSMARWRGRVIEGQHITVAHPDPAAERACCAMCNQAHDRLVRLCERDGVIGEGVRCVGADPWGIDLVARVRIHRIEFDAPATVGQAMIEATQRLLDSV